MTGLEKIVNQINADTDVICKRIFAQRCEKCKSISESAYEKADLVKNSAEIKAREIYNEITTRAYSSAEIEKRKILLTARQKAIADGINNARTHILDLPDSEYFNFIYNLISAYSLNRVGLIRLNSRDLNRLTEDFTKTANSFTNGSLSLATLPVNIDGGFILSYDGIDVNCSLNSLFAGNIDRISDAVADILFD